MRPERRLWIHRPDKAGIAHSHIFIPVVTEASIRRGWVHQEIGFKDFSKLRFETYARTKCKASMVRYYEDVIEGHLAPYLGNVPLTSISPVKVQKYVSRKLSEKKRNKEGDLVQKLSPKTVINHLVPLKEMFKHAVRWVYLKENPAQYVERPRVERAEMDFLTPEERRLFLENVTPMYHALFLTAVLTGLRRGELLALQWGDIQFANNMIHVRRSLYKGEFVSLKSRRSVRKVLMSPVLATVLKKYKLHAQPKAQDLVFANGEGRAMDPDNLVRRVFLPALRRSVLRKVRFHDLRHSLPHS